MEHEHKNLIQRLWGKMNEPRYEKPLLVLIPCLALFLCLMILGPHLLGLTARDSIVIEDEPAAVPTAPPPVTRAPIVVPSPTPSPEPTPGPEDLIPASLRANSVDRDLYITVCGEDGRPIAGTPFTLDVTFPGGESYSYESETDGSCYLVRLAAGEYRVSLRERDGYAKAEPITCTVSSSAQYQPIEDIQTLADVKDVSQVSENERPADDGYVPAELIPEEIITPEESPFVPELPVTAETPEPTPEPEPVQEEISRRIVYHVGPNGFLLFRDTGEESDVLPIDEDGDGNPDFGLRTVPQETDEEGNVISQAYTVSVELFYPDGSPVELYDIAVEENVIIIITPPEPTPEPRPEPSPQPEEPGTGWLERDGKTYYRMDDGSFAVGLKKIDGKLYYFNIYGVKAGSLGIDVSFYNNDIDWQRVKAQGIDFAIIRVGGRTWANGTLYDDCRTQEYLRGARAAGLKIGVYFYSTAINTYEAVEEASVAVNTLGGITLDYPIFIDIEYSGIYPNARHDNLSPGLRASIATAFCETVRNAGYRPGVYSGQNFYKTAIDYNALSSYYIWMASYTANNKLPDFPYRYDMWQFTDRAAVDGIEGGVDMDVIF